MQFGGGGDSKGVVQFGGGGSKVISYVVDPYCSTCANHRALQYCGRSAPSTTPVCIFLIFHAVPEKDLIK